jgi:hypothetical protein
MREVTSPVHWLTFRELPFGTVDTSKNLSHVIPRIFLHELVQPLPGMLDVLDRKNILCQYDCFALSNVTCP